MQRERERENENENEIFFRLTEVRKGPISALYWCMNA